MNQHKTAFIIIAYHPKLKELHTLLTQLAKYPTIIIDNGGTLTLDDVGRATLLSQAKNLGYGAAANIGIHHASGIGAKWFVILNQDILFSEGSASEFISLLKKLTPCVAGPFAAGLDQSRWTTILPSDRTDYLTGSCIAIHERIVGKIGYFYEPYFLYYEDADYCIRARNAGYPVTQVTLPGMAHEETATLGRGSRLHQYYLARNHMLFVRRLAPTPVKFYEFFRLIKTIAEHITRREKSALIGLRDFLFGRFGMHTGRWA